MSHETSAALESLEALHLIVSYLAGKAGLVILCNNVTTHLTNSARDKHKVRRKTGTHNNETISRMYNAWLLRMLRKKEEQKENSGKF